MGIDEGSFFFCVCVFSLQFFFLAFLLPTGVFVISPFFLSTFFLCFCVRCRSSFVYRSLDFRAFFFVSSLYSCSFLVFFEEFVLLHSAAWSFVSSLFMGLNEHEKGLPWRTTLLLVTLLYEEERKRAKEKEK
ncbi:hypothetical protein DFP73DRAFT_62199 [Morchella snyderi]|nr:hypothetical protein DFP73DRAFT_62199 [Morchella snyderi]